MSSIACRRVTVSFLSVARNQPQIYGGLNFLLDDQTQKQIKTVLEGFFQGLVINGTPADTAKVVVGLLNKSIPAILSLVSKQLLTGFDLPGTLQDMVRKLDVKVWIQKAVQKLWDGLNKPNGPIDKVRQFLEGRRLSDAVGDPIWVVQSGKNAGRIKRNRDYLTTVLNRWKGAQTKPALQTEIQQFIDKEPWQVKGHKVPGAVDSLLDHVKKQIGKPKKLALHEIVPGDPPITVHLVPRKKKPQYLALVTTGMSDKPMTAPAGGEDYQYAEVVMYLPAWWKEKEVKAPENAWVTEWIRRVGHYPQEHKTWLGGPSALIDNGEPPAPLGEGVPFTSVFAVADRAIEPAVLPDGRKVVFYMLFPLFPDERNFERDKGTQALIQLLHRYWGSICVDVNRPNTVADAEGDEDEDGPPSDGIERDDD